MHMNAVIPTYPCRTPDTAYIHTTHFLGVESLLLCIQKKNNENMKKNKNINACH